MHSLISILIKSKVCKEDRTRKLHELEKVVSKNSHTAFHTENMSFIQPVVCRYQKPPAATHIFKYLPLRTNSTSGSSWQIRKRRLFCRFKRYFLRTFDKSVIKKWTIYCCFVIESHFFLILLTKGSERWTLANFVVTTTDVNLPDWTRATEPAVYASILTLMQKQQVLTEKPCEKMYSATAAFVQWPCFSLYSKVFPLFYLSNPQHRA